MDHGYSVHSCGCGWYALLYHGHVVFEGDCVAVHERLVSLVEVLGWLEDDSFAELGDYWVQ